MITLRTYFTEPEALVAKSLLDDHGIFCAVADSNAHLYGGAPFGMPVRLLVAEEDVDKATQVLNDPTREYGLNREMVPSEQGEVRREPNAKNNPWEILAIASLFFLPGIALLLQTQELVLLSPMGEPHIRTLIQIQHTLGLAAIVVAVFLAILFFKTRRAIMRERPEQEAGWF